MAKKGVEKMYKRLTSFENLYLAYQAYIKRKRRKDSVQRIEPLYESVLWRLKEDLENQSWRPSSYSAFIVTEPSVREIFAADIRDRIVHHALFRMINPIFERCFIPHSYACRKGKGTHLAVKDLQKALQRYSRGGRKVYFLKLDIRSFFSSIDKEILVEIISRKIKDEDVMRLTKKIIFTHPAEGARKKGQLELFARIPKEKSLFCVDERKGLPIGNLTSQLFANIYLNELDKFIKHKLKVRYYFRYVDDLVILDSSSRKLEIFIKRIASFLTKKLKLELNPKKAYIKRAEDGIDFLGYIVRKDYILVRKRIVDNFRRKMFEFEKNRLKGERINPELIAQVSNSYGAHFKHANSYRLRKRLKEKYSVLLGDRSNVTA